MTAEALARRNILVLTAATALGAAGPPIIISLGGIVGQMLSPDAALVTLPVSLYSLGLAMGTIPAALVMRRFGRRSGYLFGAGIGVFAGLVATLGIVMAAFVVFCLGTFMAGFYGAYVQSYRFAATDAVEGALKAKAISWVMIGGLMAAVIGPQLVIHTRDAFPAAPFAGSFLSQAALALLALPVLMLLRAPPATAGHAPAGQRRSLREILLRPRLMLAIAAGIVSYGLMSFVMTAAPIAMIGCGFTVGEAALGIQWHVLAMFAPSFVTGHLMARFGKERVTAAGLLLTAAAGGVALMGLELAHFWISLILLGVGWNFGFIGATAMVTDCHTPEEKGQVQGLNDFLIFGTVAAASFSAGTLLTASGWELINWLIFPTVALVLVPLLWRLPGRREQGALP
ncbi:MAG: MFS transporter [Pseudochelatococcus sp.]|jgi:MFS family permease|uniref:MFS transporter n=1 Tax=Pseudochelatococcus sp. TaxID=2020869 RepID=UPI003D8F3159